MITILNETTRREIDRRNKQMWNDIRQSLKDNGDSDWENPIGYQLRLPKDVSSKFLRYSSETSCIDMIHSILTYSDPETWTVDNILKDHYLQKYINELGKDTVAALIQQEIDEYQNATINYNDFTDSEGVSYNSVRFRDDESYKRESIFGGKQTLADWISNPRNKKRYGNDEIMVVCMTPYSDDIDDCPGVLFDGSFDELFNGTGDNYISDTEDSWVVTGTTYKRYGSTDFLEISVDSIN